MKRQRAKLVLQDGSFFEGFLFGSKTTASGEAVFNTSMVGYAEAMTDPSYFGQILIFTYPLIGNYGIPSQEKSAEGFFLHFESGRIQPKGIVVQDYSEQHSHWQATQSLENWMKEQGVPGVTGVDTRALTKKLREQGTMLAQILAGDAAQNEWYDPNASNALPFVSVKEDMVYGKGELTILLIDCGVKEGIIRSLVKREVRVIRVPYNAHVARYSFDGVVISNGPGDPTYAKESIETMKELMHAENPKPLFGICLGNQLMALAAGAKTVKLPYGHRSQNQPCQDLETGKCFITSQNHGFAVQEQTLPADWNVWFRNVNDETVEGIKHKTKSFFAVQFHPEASPGPTDTNFLFDTFLSVCQKQK